MHNDGLNDLRLQNSIHAFLLHCWSADLPAGNWKNRISLVVSLSLLQPYTGQYMLIVRSAICAEARNLYTWANLGAQPQSK